MKLQLAFLICFLGVSRGCPAQEEISYSIKTRTSHSVTYKDTAQGIYYKKTGKYMYFRPIDPDQLYIMLAEIRYRKLKLQYGDTIWYNSKPNVHYRIIKTSRTVRRFKR